MLSGHTRYWAQPILGCNSRLGRFAGITEIITEIVGLGDRLGRSGYCPMLRLLPVQYCTAVCPHGLLGWSVGVFIRELERAYERVGAGSRDAVVGFHVSREILRSPSEILSSGLPFTADWCASSLLSLSL